MSLALELFLLIMIFIVGAVALAFFLTRDIWQRLWKNIVNQDRAERAVLEERKLETEQRNRAERELEECLGEDIRNADDKNVLDKTVLKWSDSSTSESAENRSNVTVTVQKTNEK